MKGLTDRPPRISGPKRTRKSPKQGVVNEQVGESCLPGFVRPLKDFLAKEIGLYSHFSAICYTDCYFWDATSAASHLPPLFPSFATLVPRSTSINGLTEELIISLQAEFPHTVNTVIRTAEKLLTVKLDNNLHAQFSCPLCQRSLTKEELKQVSLVENLEKAGLFDSSCYSCQRLLKEIDLSSTNHPNSSSSDTGVSSSPDQQLRSILPPALDSQSKNLISLAKMRSALYLPFLLFPIASDHSHPSQQQPL